MKRTSHLALLALVTVAAAAAIGLAVQGGRAQESEPPPTTPTAHFAETIVVPDGLGRIETELRDVNGQPIAVSCSTCHSARYAPMIRAAEQLDEFHGGLAFDHGELVCGQCHDADDRDQLRLANGETLPFTHVIEVCGQCHGPQYRDYKKGTHGGMQGYWDLSRGPRTRNNCVHCHDPHAPAYPTVTPEPPPRDTLGRSPKE